MKEWKYNLTDRSQTIEWLRAAGITMPSESFSFTLNWEVGRPPSLEFKRHYTKPNGDIAVVDGVAGVRER